MTDNIQETYTFKIVRNKTEFSAVEYNLPADEFGRKMLSIMLMNIAEHIDPANSEGVSYASTDGK